MMDNIYILVVLAMSGTIMIIVMVSMIIYAKQKRIILQQLELTEIKMTYYEDISHSVIEAQETERRRIGQDLHDNVGGNLAALKMIINHMLEQREGDELQSINTTIKKTIDGLIADVRDISYNISPEIFTLLSPSEAIHDLLGRVKSHAGLKVTYEIEGLRLFDRLEKMHAISIYRVLQELLTNTLKHAEASQIMVDIALKDGLLNVVYKDNGKGFKMDKKESSGMGLHNIGSRLQFMKATFEMTDSGPGFCLDILIPLI